MPGTDRRPRRGFVLPTTMLVVTLLTVMLAAAFILVSADYRTTLNAFATARALALAQAGLQNYLSVGHSLLAVTKDSAAYPFSNGWAAVVARQIRDSTTTSPRQPALWVVESIGFDTVRALAGQPNGQRAVAQFATLRPGILPARAAMVAANGDSMLGSGFYGNPISGRNFNFAIAGCVVPARADTMGLTTVSGGYVGSGGNDVDGMNGPYGGSIEFLANASRVIDSTRIDWAKLVGGQFTPDFVGVYPAAGNNTYQSHYFTGDVTIPAGQRRGLLVVTGNVTFSSGTHWDGILVAGGYIDFGPSFVLHGMAVSGLNGTTTKNRVTRGVGTIQWDWCYLHASMSSLMYLVPISNAWVDTWSTY